MSNRRVLLTGAAGGVARMLLPGLVESYDVVVTDRRPVDDLGAAEGLPLAGRSCGDLGDPAFVARVTDGVDAVVHLAANPNPRASWDQLRGPNVDVVASLLASGVPRFVLASSAHVMGQYAAGGRVPVDPDWPVAPCCAYGATKAFVEALGRVHAYRTGVPVVALRLGATIAEPPASSALTAWLGPADLRQLVVRALEADVAFTVCAGMSANTRGQWDLRNEIGYVPELDSERYADEVPLDDSWGPCVP